MALERAKRELQTALPRAAVRWVAAEQMHLTMKFLGDIETDQIGPLTGALRAACGGCPVLELCASGLCCFPDLRFPRVLCAAVEDPHRELKRLHSAICTAVSPFVSPEPDKPFTAHITLGRIKRISKPEVRIVSSIVSRMATSMFGGWTARSIELMRSELSAQGPTHTCLAQISLQEE